MNPYDSSYITPYILNKAVKDPQIQRALKFELDQKYYHYGDHFKNNIETSCPFFKNIKKKISAYKGSVDFFKNKIFSSPKSGKTIVSTAYLSASKYLSMQEINITGAPWALRNDSSVQFNHKLFSICRSFEEKISLASPRELVSAEFIDKVYQMKKVLKEFYSQKNIVAGLFPNDVGFFESISIAVLKELSKKSFVYIHGLPAYYEKGTYDSPDYVLVYGESVKSHLIKIGIIPSKILIVGHPSIKPKSINVRSSLENILVLGSSHPGAQLKLDQVTLWDRGNIILYCHHIQEVLEQMGVKQVSFRPHPSENVKWYEKHIDLNFFKLDTKTPIESLLSQSSLVIGPTSTVALEALSSGVNYIVYEPFSQRNEKESTTYGLVPPFDGNDERLVVAKNLSELKDCLVKNKKSSAELLSDYSCSEFTLEQTIASLI